MTILKLVLSVAGLYVVAGAILHYWVFPEPPPDLKSLPLGGEEIVNCFSGERLIFIKTGAETGGKYTENEIRLQPGGAVPKAHIHLHGDETFSVLSGKLTLVEDGKEIVLGAGAVHTIRKGTPHQPFNRGTEPVVARVRIAPAGRADLMLAQVHGFLTERRRGEMEWFLQAMLYSVYYDTFLASPPVWVQKTLSFLISPTARLFGYRSWYPAYSKKWKAEARPR